MDVKRAIFTEVSDDDGRTWHRQPDRWEHEMSQAPPSVPRAFASHLRRGHRHLMQEHAHTSLLNRAWLTLTFCAGALAMLSSPLWIPYVLLKWAGLF